MVVSVVEDGCPDHVAPIEFPDTKLRVAVVPPKLNVGGVTASVNSTVGTVIGGAAHDDPDELLDDPQHGHVGGIVKLNEPAIVFPH